MNKPTYPTLPPNQDRRKKLTETDKKKIQTLKTINRLSDRKIAEIMGVHEKTVRYWNGDKERQNAKTIKRLKAKPLTPEQLKEKRAKTAQHRIDVLGLETVRAFQRDNKAFTLRESNYKDYRTTCKLCHARFSSRLHVSCPVCLANRTQDYVRQTISSK